MKLLKWGLSQAASDAYAASGHDPARLGQTIGNAALSKGTHIQDGTDEFGNPYSAAVDISVKSPTRLTDDEIRTLCNDLAAHDFVPFPRLPWHPEDGWHEVAHIHCIYVKQPMKRELRLQVHEWFAGRNGLASDSIYHFWHPTDAQIIERLRSAFLEHNPAEG